MKNQQIIHLAGLGLWLLAVVAKAELNDPKNNSVEPLLAAAVEPAVDVNLRWQAGQRYRFRMETIVRSQFEPQADQPTAKTFLSLAHEYAVTEQAALADGGHKLELEFLAQKFQFLNGKSALTSFDSTQPVEQDAASPIAPILRRLTGAKIKCEIAGDGHTMKIDGFNKLTIRLAGGQPLVQVFLEEIFSETNIRQLLDFTQTLRGDHSVKPGEDWPVRLELTDPVGPLIVNAQCVFKTWEMRHHRRCARIQYVGAVTSPPALDQPMATLVETGKLSGNLWFDPVLGMVVDSNCQQQLVLKTTTQGRSTTTKVNQTTNIRLLESNAT